jgi:tripartite-type tricarboxylate transporter receptor subunit TctC
MRVKSGALRTIARAISAAALSLACGYAAAQAYPSKTVRIIVPVPPGGANDTLTRVIAPKLSEQLRQPVIIDNRAGGNTTIGTAVVGKSAPDGYTLLSAPSAHTVNAALYSTLPYDPIKDFTPIAGIAATPLFLAVHPSLPVKSVKELIALAKSKPDQLNYGSPGTGTSGHLAGELFKSVAGVRIVHIAYKGGGPATTDLVGGHILMMFPTLQAAMSYVPAGKLRALAVTSAKRSALAPELPTMAEAGLPKVEVRSWFALLGPAGLPKEIVSKLDTDIGEVIKAVDVSQRLRALGYDSFYMSSDQLGAFLRSDLAKWTKVVREAGIRADS